MIAEFPALCAAVGAANVAALARLSYIVGMLCPGLYSVFAAVDVLLVPVDGGFTMDVEGMVEVIQAMKAPLMVPMHYFSTFTLRRFLERVNRQYEVEFAETPSFVVSKATLPSKGKFLVLPGH